MKEVTGHVFNQSEEMITGGGNSGALTGASNSPKKEEAQMKTYFYIEQKVSRLLVTFNFNHKKRLDSFLGDILLLKISYLLTYVRI